MVEGKVIRLTDRSRTVTKWKCDRKRFWATEFQGRGIVPLQQAEPLSIGTAWHTGTERILKFGEDYAVVARECGRDIAAILERNAVGVWGEEAPNLEWQRWMEGMLYAAGKYIIPEILRDHTVFSVEQETLFDVPEVAGFVYSPSNPLPTIRLMGRPDLILKRSDGSFWYWEWKTTGWLDTRWLRQWDKDVQLMGAAKAVKAVQGIKLEGCIVQGVYKGFRKDGRLNHILVNAYATGGIAGVNRADWSPRYVKGWDKVGTDEFEGGVTAWVDYLWEQDQQLIRDLFPRTLPISINERLVESYFRQIWLSEIQLWYAEQDPDQDTYLDLYYPQHFTECEPSMGGKCPYLDACWNEEIGSDPVGSGTYQWREPHHEAEMESIG